MFVLFLLCPAAAPARSRIEPVRRRAKARFFQLHAPTQALEKRRSIYGPTLPMRSSSKSRMPECQSGDAGANPADRTIFPIDTAGASCAARSPKPRGSGATPERRAIFIVTRVRGPRVGQRARKLRGRLMARHRFHKPFIAGSIPAPATILLFWAARSFRRSPASHAGEHGAKPWRSIIFPLPRHLHLSLHPCR